MKLEAVHPPSSGRSPMRLMRGLEREHHRGEQRARGAGRRSRPSRPAPRSADRSPCPGTMALNSRPIPAPKPPPIVNNGASVPPDVPLPERDRPGHELQRAEDEQRAARISTADDVFDVVVAHAQRARREVTDHADRQTADRRPPHPVDRQVLERVLDRVDELGHDDRRHSDHRAERDVERDRRAVHLHDVRHREDRLRTHQGQPHGRGRGGGERHRDQRALAVFKKQ